MKDDRCPICDNQIVSLPGHKPHQNTFDYYCRLCSPSANVIISISGDVFTSEKFDRMLKDNKVKLHLMEKIWHCRDKEVGIDQMDIA